MSNEALCSCGMMASASCCMPFLREVKSGGAGLFEERCIFALAASMARPRLP